MERAKELLLNVMKALCDQPNEVSIDVVNDDMGVLFTLHLNEADMGQVIGKEGGTAKAIRTLIRIAGLKDGARVSLKIAEPIR